MPQEYVSTKTLPYVYMGTHKITNKFYIGYREMNNRPSHKDLYTYKTSSKVVKPIFNEFNWIILAEFYDGNDAYDFEQYLINSHWDNPLLLNKNCHYEKPRFKSNKGRKGRKGYALAKDIVTNKCVGLVSKQDTRWSTGEIVFYFTGTKQSHETIQQRLDNTDREKLKSMQGKKGINHPRTGSFNTKEQNDRISLAGKGKKKPVGFNVGIKNSNYGKKHPGLNSGKDNPMFGKVGKLHPNFGKTMPVTEGRFRGRLELYKTIIDLLEQQIPVKEIHKMTNLEISTIYNIRNKTHAIWKYLEKMEINNEF